MAHNAHPHARGAEHADWFVLQHSASCPVSLHPRRSAQEGPAGSPGRALVALRVRLMQPGLVTCWLVTCHVTFMETALGTFELSASIYWCRVRELNSRPTVSPL